MLCLNIRQQPAKLELQIQPASYTVTATPAKLSLDTEAATVDIRQPRGKLEVDATPSRASYGLLTSEAFLRDAAERGRQTALETVARIAEEGDLMAAIESGEDAIVNIATESNFPPGPEITLAWVEPPNIRYTASPPEFTPKPGKVNISVQPGTIQGDYQRGQVTGKITQYQRVWMWTSEGKYDISV